MFSGNFKSAVQSQIIQVDEGCVKGRGYPRDGQLLSEIADRDRRIQGDRQGDRQTEKQTGRQIQTDRETDGKRD